MTRRHWPAEWQRTTLSHRSLPSRLRFLPSAPTLLLAVPGYCPDLPAPRPCPRTGSGPQCTPGRRHSRPPRCTAPCRCTPAFPLRVRLRNPPGFRPLCPRTGQNPRHIPGKRHSRCLRCTAPCRCTPAPEVPPALSPAPPPCPRTGSDPQHTPGRRHLRLPRCTAPCRCTPAFPLRVRLRNPPGFRPLCPRTGQNPRHIPGKRHSRCLRCTAPCRCTPAFPLFRPQHRPAARSYRAKPP